MRNMASDRRPILPRAVCYLLLASTCLSLTGCSSLKEMFSSFSFGANQEEETASSETLAATAMNDYSVGNYSDALRSFQEILDRYPFSPEALLAELKAADCQYYAGKYAEAKELYKTFEEQHPTNEAIPYVMFQIGMCDFSRADRIDRDPSGARDALQSFDRLLRVYPNSPYTREAKARRHAAQEFLVNHEYFVAVFYVRTKKYEQAKHRLKYIIALYPDASVLPKAKELLKKLEDGQAPKWGLAKWLPDLHMPDWKWWKDKEDTVEDTAREAEMSRNEQ
jgi:outer membrane protein assembly factor BamD